MSTRTTARTAGNPRTSTRSWRCPGPRGNRGGRRRMSTRWVPPGRRSRPSSLAYPPACIRGSPSSAGDLTCPGVPARPSRAIPVRLADRHLFGSMAHARPRPTWPSAGQSGRARAFQVRNLHRVAGVACSAPFRCHLRSSSGLCELPHSPLSPWTGRWASGHPDVLIRSLSVQDSVHSPARRSLGPPRIRTKGSPECHDF